MADYVLVDVPGKPKILIPDDIDKYLAEETTEWFLDEIVQREQRIAELEKQLDHEQITIIAETAIAWALGKPPCTLIEACRAALQKQEGKRNERN